MENFIIGFILLVNIATFAIYGVDKMRAIKHNTRVPQATLLALAALGGSVGAMMGIWGLRHKTRHKSFTIGIPAIIFAQVMFALWMASTGMNS